MNSRARSAYNPVTALFQHLDPVIVELTIDGETITTTPEHPFYTDENIWVDAADLVVGESIRTLDGSDERTLTQPRPITKNGCSSVVWMVSPLMVTSSVVLCSCAWMEVV